MNDKYQEAFSKLSSLKKEVLPKSEWIFLEDEYGRGFNTYLERIKYLGLENCGAILDAGSGAGNWTFPLASVNTHVYAVDIDSARLQISQTMQDLLLISNVTIKYGNLEDLPLNDNSIDGILCYSVLMRTNITRVLEEFNRVLVPGGKLYLMVDLWSWYLNDYLQTVEDNKLLWLCRFILMKIVTGRPKFLTARRIRRLLMNSGFKIVMAGLEGHSSFNLDNYGEKIVFYPDTIRAKSPLYELCALKSQVG